MTNSKSTTNPNSNLHFDFPDPTPRFEFDDSPARSTSSSFASKRVRVGGGGGGVVQQRIKLFGGRFATKRNGKKGRSGVGHNANGGSSSPGGLSLTTTSTTACSTPSTGSVATPGSGSGRSLTSRSSNGGGRRTNSESQSLFELDDAPLRIPLHGGGGGGHRKAALSYVSAGSESEFSFDRVTVTTNETGNFSNSKMSSIDWGFIDGFGGSSSGGDGGANNNNNNNDDDGIVNGQQQQQRQHAPSFVIAAGMDAAACAARGRTVVPPPVIERKSPITRLSPSSSSSSSQAIQQNHKLSIHRLSPTIMGQDHLRRSYSPPRGRGHRLHLPHDYDIDSSSLPGSDVPVLMKSVNKSNNVDDQSVISEISERTGAFFMDDNDNNENANDAVRALLYGEGGKIEEEEMSPKSTTTATVRYKMNSGFGGGGGVTSSPAASTKGQTIETPSYIHRQHQRLRTTKSNDCCKNDNTPFFSLASSSPMTTIKALVEDIQTKYDTYMAARSSSGGSSSQQEEKQGQEQHQGCSIQSIIEDLQFCGWYLCGMIDTTTITSPKQQQQKQKDATLEKTMLDAKEVRKKEAELTFLGKDIAVCGANTHFSSTTGIATNSGGGGGRGNWCTQL